MNSIIFRVMMLNEQIKAFRKDEKGVTMVEYGLIASLIAVVCAAAVKLIGSDLNTKFNAIATCISAGTC